MNPTTKIQWLGKKWRTSCEKKLTFVGVNRYSSNKYAKEEVRWDQCVGIIYSNVFLKFLFILCLMLCVIIFFSTEV